jgi:predicted TIM-barrel fold metal-dependent hydrolase
MIIDCDAHLATLNCFDRLSDRDWRETYINDNRGNIIPIEQHISEAKNKLGLQKQVINFFGGSVGLGYGVPASLGREVMQVYNDHMIDVMSQSNNFFTANAWLSLQDIPACLEAMSYIPDKNFFGYFVDDTIAWGGVDAVRPIFQKAHDQNMPVYIHVVGGRGMQGKIFDYRYNKVMVSLKQKQWTAQCKIDPVDQFLLMLVSLLESDWWNTMPNLKIVLAERGIDWIEPLRAFMIEQGRPDPLPRLQKNFWFTTEPEHIDFKKHGDLIGWDRLLFATDHGHGGMDCGGWNYGRDIETIKNLGLTQEQMDQLTHKNFQKIIQR